MCDPSPTVIVMQLAKAHCELISRKTIRNLQELKDGSLLSGDDSGLANVWDEICVQVQHEESFHWDLYEDLILQIVSNHVDELEEYSKQAIWLQTSPGEDWYFEDEEYREPADVLSYDIADHIWGEYIHPKAENWTNKRITAYPDL